MRFRLLLVLCLTASCQNFLASLPYIEPLHRCVWDEAQGVYVETPEVYGFKVVDWQGHVVGVGETCDEAHENALSAMDETLRRE